MGWEEAGVVWGRRNLLFRASASATQALEQDPRFVEGMIDVIGVLQTWTCDLMVHPHIHDLVPGGGLAPDGQSWHAVGRA